MNRLSSFTALAILGLFCCSHMSAAPTSITPEQEQAAIKEVREQVPKLREEGLRKAIPADWSALHPSGGSVLSAALAALRLNVDVEQANQALQKHAEGKLMGGIPEFYPLMEAYAQIYYLFNSRSSFFPGRLTPQTEAAMKAQMWEFVQRFKLADVSQTDPLQLINTENHDIRGRSGVGPFFRPAGAQNKLWDAGVIWFLCVGSGGVNLRWKRGPDFFALERKARLASERSAEACAGL